MKPRRIHQRQDGPVRIDPDKREVVHVIGDLPDAPHLAANLAKLPPEQLQELLTEQEPKTWAEN